MFRRSFGIFGYFALIVIIVFSFQASAFAAPNGQSQRSDLEYVNASRYITPGTTSSKKFSSVDDVFKSHGGTFKHVNLKDLPAGTAVINANSLEDVDALLSSISNGFTNALSHNVTITIPNASNQQSALMVSPLSTSSGQVHSVIYDAKSWWVSLYSNYLASDSSGSWAITNVTASTGLNGFTLGISWNQTFANSTKVNDISWYTTGGGTYSLVIFVSGIGTVYSQTVSGYHYCNLVL